MTKIINWAYRILGLIPLLWAISVIIFHYYVVNIIGFQPTYNNPAQLDNDTIWTLGSYLILFFIVSGYCLIVFIGLLTIQLVLKFFKKTQVDFLNIGISSLGLIIAIVVNIIPRFSDTLTWLFD
jgi:hypothetical protein